MSLFKETPEESWHRLLVPWKTARYLLEVLPGELEHCCEALAKQPPDGSEELTALLLGIGCAGVTLELQVASLKVDHARFIDEIVNDYFAIQDDLELCRKLDSIPESEPDDASEVCVSDTPQNQRAQAIGTRIATETAIALGSWSSWIANPHPLARRLVGLITKDEPTSAQRDEVALRTRKLLFTARFALPDARGDAARKRRLREEERLLA